MVTGQVGSDEVDPRAGVAHTSPSGEQPRHRLLRDVGRQLVRNREAFGKKPEDMPVFGTSAATFNDDGVTALYQHLRGILDALAKGPLPADVVAEAKRRLVAVENAP